MKLAPSIAVIAICLAAAACGGGSGSAPVVPPVAVVPPPAPPPPPPSLGSVEREIAPLLTDAAITTNLSAHVAINPDPAVAAKNRFVRDAAGDDGDPAFLPPDPAHRRAARLSCDRADLSQ